MVERPMAHLYTESNIPYLHEARVSAASAPFIIQVNCGDNKTGEDIFTCPEHLKQ